MPLIPCLLRRAAALLLAAAAAGASFAQTFPERPVTLVVPYPPGGATDLLARAVALQLQDRWKQPVIVDNRPGASAVIGASAVARAKPDGYTLLISDSSTYVTVPHMMEKLPFNVQRDFVPVTIVGRQVAVLATRNGFPAGNTREFIDYAKAHPGKVTFASFGIGTWAHIAMEELSKTADIQMLHVPFRGGSQALTELMAERVDVFFATLGVVNQYTGKVKFLATATPTRTTARPDMPTMAETGLPGYSLSLWFGLVAPAGTPTALVDRIQKDIAAMQGEPGYQEKVLKAYSLERGGETREQFATILRTESEKWKRVIEQAGVKAEGK